jgi:hypothetical protein
MHIDTQGVGRALVPSAVRRCGLQRLDEHTHLPCIDLQVSCRQPTVAEDLGLKVGWLASSVSQDSAEHVPLMLGWQELARHCSRTSEAVLYRLIPPTSEVCIYGEAKKTPCSGGHVA